MGIFTSTTKNIVNGTSAALSATGKVVGTVGSVVEGTAEWTNNALNEQLVVQAENQHNRAQVRAVKAKSELEALMIIAKSDGRRAQQEAKHQAMQSDIDMLPKLMDAKATLDAVNQYKGVSKFKGTKTEPVLENTDTDDLDNFDPSNFSGF